MRDNRYRRQRLAAESEEQRKVRLQRMRDNHRNRMATETEEEREARLQQMSANQRDGLARLKPGSERSSPPRLLALWPRD